MSQLVPSISAKKDPEFVRSTILGGKVGTIDPIRRPAALVVQGGGMRGTYSIGALATLEHAGLAENFDYVIGSSAGAINASYLLARQTEDSVRGYLEDLSDDRFINFRRPWKIVDIDYLIDHVVKGTRKLQIGEIRGSCVELQVVLTNVMTGEACVFRGTDRDFDFYEVLRATAALPILYGREIGLGTEKFVDGGVSESIPFLRAIELGCKSILVITTVLPDRRRPGLSGFEKIVAKIALRNNSAEFRNRLLLPDTEFNKTMELLFDEGTHDGEVHFATVSPSDATKLVSRTTRDLGQLQACVEMGREDMRQWLLPPGGD